MAGTNNKLGELQINSVSLSWQKKAMLDVLTRCRTLALHISTSPLPHSSSWTCLPVTSDKMATIRPPWTSLQQTDPPVFLSSSPAFSEAVSLFNKVSWKHALPQNHTSFSFPSPTNPLPGPLHEFLSLHFPSRAQGHSLLMPTHPSG